MRAIEELPALGGSGVQPSLCIVIETDGRDERVPAAAAPAWPADRAAQREALRAGGIVGLGGAVYPTADKLATPVPCKALIVNGAECEPYISCDDMLMRENAAEIVAGAVHFDGGARGAAAASSPSNATSRRQWGPSRPPRATSTTRD